MILAKKSINFGIFNRISTKKNNSLVCAEIQSRHVNRTKNKVFVEYEPNNDHINSIKDICLT